MKNQNSYFSFALMSTLLTSSLFAQTNGQEQDQSTPQKDLQAVNLKVVYKPRTISLWDSGNGFICKYVIDNVYYMTRYDKQGNYVETLVQKEWNDDVPTMLLAVFQQSQFKSRQVMSYWEVSDQNKTGYYLEMTDNHNQVSCVWVDKHGKFSTKPPINQASTSK